jgi:hypothetical protein
VPRAELACSRVGDEGDVMAAQPVRPALRLLAGRAVCMAINCCILHDVEIRSSICVGGVARVVHPCPRTGRSQTCRARRRLSSSGKLVGDAANWPKTRRLASVGFDQGSFFSLSLIFALTLSVLAFTLSILAFTLSILLDHLVVLGDIILPSKGA